MGRKPGRAGVGRQLGRESPTARGHGGHARQRDRFRAGIWQTRADHQKLLGVPVDLTFGLAAHAAGFMGMGGKAAPYLHSVGNGALAARFHTVGRGIGKEMREKAGLASVAMSGEGPAEGGSNLSDDALLEMARRRG